ncbi:putative cardiolipin-specific deacylase, mitochondrial [Smittium culicis]|uniref:Putative cardiolipin-specific deacylase, mitochondrial n=1 Tax=Smittium culicis TaxID=133412 RepID=A0A1R1XZZ0_9FUNG|nr:putative cardiolipin-specific deacylase, mitochondrial [Smittium culicis]
MNDFFTRLYIPTSRKDAEKAEKQILELSGLDVEYPEDLENSNCQKSVSTTSKLFNLHFDKDNYLRTLHIKNNNIKTAKNKVSEPINLVITHGFGTALGFFFKNYKELSEIDGINMYSIDWLGMGLSSRPEFEIDKSLPIEKQISKAEEFFVDSLEKWRQEMGIEKMNLLGHSFGGYMSSIYALKYPERVNKLILESPMGLPETPDGVNSFLETGEIPELQMTINPSSNAIVSEKNPDFFHRFRDLSPTYKLLLKGSVSLWNNSYTPQGIVRFLGRFGPGLAEKYIGSFRSLNTDESKALSQYMYHVSAQRGSGEYSLGILLKPFAFARIPLITRLHNLTMPTYFIYGDRDWMDRDAGINASKSMKNHSRFYLVSNAGHNMHIDNPREFNKYVKSIITEEP